MAFKDLLNAAKRRLGLVDPVTKQLKDLPREEIRLTNPWHAVTIQPGPKRCAAVEALLGQRFLSRDAPSLPLKDCTESQCTCRYRHYEDRRHEGVPLDRNGMPLPHPHRRNND
jgi:hypothetical protein